jgi:hypothetical protein
MRVLIECLRPLNGPVLRALRSALILVRACGVCLRPIGGAIYLLILLTKYWNGIILLIFSQSPVRSSW